MILRLRSGSSSPSSAGEEPVCRVHADHPDAKVLRESLHDLVALAEAQEAVVHEHAGELVADGAMQERRDHGGIDSA